MRASRTIARLGAFACLFVTASLWMRTALQSSAAPSGYVDVPGSLAANADGDVYVSFWTDYGAAVVRRFSADGAVLSRWEVAGASSFPFHAIAEAGDGGLFVALADADVVRRYSNDGRQTAEWPVAGLENAIAATAGGSTNADVYVLTSLLGGGAAVLQYDPAGSLRSSFPVDRSSYDLAVWAQGGADEAPVAVAEADQNQATGAFVSRYSEAGTWLDGWPVDGAIAGMDVDGATEALWLGVTDQVKTTRFFYAVNRDQTRYRKCDLPAYPIDLTVGKDGDLYVLADQEPAFGTHRELHRYGQDCRLLDTWDLSMLNGFEQPTPTGPTPTASQTPSATLVPDTATPQEGYPTSATATNAPTGTITPTPVLYPQRWWLPIAWRSGG